MTANVGHGDSDLGDHNNDFISDTKLDHVAESEAKVWSRQGCVSDHMMRLGNGVRGEQGIDGQHVQSVALAGR